MILKASVRGGGKAMGLHLLKTEENEHVEVAEVSGFVSDSVLGAMNEAYALARGTRCEKYLFSLSLNPPAGVHVGPDVFEKALQMIEERNGLVGQPRVLVYHSKEGRTHAHCVWSRIDAETMTAKPLSFFKTRLRDIGKQLFLENGWSLPEGFRDYKLRDPRSFNLSEWQQAKRAGINPAQLKEAAQECWAISDNPASFAKALEERGLFLAKGDRRSHVAMTIDGSIIALSRLLGKKTKEVTARLGNPAALPSVEATREKLAGEMGQRLKAHIAEAKRIAMNGMKPLHERRDALKLQHQVERRKLDDGQSERFRAEQHNRASRLRHGVKGAWDILTGRYAKVRRQNELEAYQSLRRDRAQKDALLRDQMKERQVLQLDIEQVRTRAARQVLALYRDAAQYRRLREGRVQEASLDFGR